MTVDWKRVPIVWIALFACGMSHGIQADSRGGVESRSADDVLTIERPEERNLLSLKSRPAVPDAPGTRELIDKMERIARQHDAGGLAAVQIGVPVRVVLLRLRNGNYQAYLNPVLTRRSIRKTLNWEYCLSVPWGYLLTERFSHIAVRYRTASGEAGAETFHDGAAAVFQQELEHLEGISISDGWSRRWFIPEHEMGAFASALRQDCRDKSEAACDSLTKHRWKRRARMANSRSGGS